MKKIVFSIFLLLLTYLNITIYLQNLVIGVLTPVIIQLRVLSLDLSDSLRFYQNIERIRQENIELRKKVSLVESFSDSKKIDDVSALDYANTSKYFEDSYFQNKKVSIHEIIFYDDSGSEIYLKDFTESGVKTGDLLILGRNLIGIISYVDMGIIKADLLSKNSNQINSYILNSDNQKITTIITGEAGDNLVINNILATEIVSEGDLILTSSTNPKILADLIIGRIQRLEGISSQTFRKATIRKNYDLNFMKFIGVLSL
jgi:cell shape-determining protein MreC